MKKFDEILMRTLGIEGGVSDDPDDRGGLTNFGIVTKTYNAAVELGIIEANENGVRGLSIIEVKAIYYEMYWKPLNLDYVDSVAIAEEIFDTGVNAGISKSAKIVQRALQALGEDLERDGNLGPVTLGLVNKWIKEAPEVFFKLLNALQGAFYVEITENDPSQSKFLKGWINKRVTFYVEPKEEETDGLIEEDEEKSGGGDEEKSGQRRKRREKGFKGLAT